jgi:hypothetical protein
MGYKLRREHLKRPAKSTTAARKAFAEKIGKALKEAAAKVRAKP